MAKSKVNKSALIRDLLKANRGKAPAEIAELLKAEHGITVPAQYVSTIKSNMKEGPQAGQASRRHDWRQCRALRGGCTRR